MRSLPPLVETNDPGRSRMPSGKPALYVILPVPTTSALTPLSKMTMSQSVCAPPLSCISRSVFRWPHRCKRANPRAPAKRSFTPTFSPLLPVTEFWNSARTRAIILAMAREDSVDPRMASAAEMEYCDTALTEKRAVEPRRNPVDAIKDAVVME